MRQLDRVSRELLARAWAAGVGPGDSPLSIDLDSTICETYGLDKEGARHHGYTGQRGYHPLLAVAARLSQPFPFPRVDMYARGSEVKVGELTNCPHNAGRPFSPQSVEFTLGRFLDDLQN